MIAEIQDEFTNMKRAMAREQSGDDKLTTGDVPGFGAGVKDAFPRAAKGCEIFVSVWATEQADNAPNN